MKERRLLVSGGVAVLLLAGCGRASSVGGSLTLPAEELASTPSTSVSVDASATVAVTEPAVSITSHSTIPATTSPATSAPPVATAAATVVETLPQPADPPAPRAVEPYLELGTIEIPSLSLSMPLLEGISLTTLDRGPGHWPGTALPGQLGNVVVAGHRTSHGKVFRHIDQLVPGDEVIFTTPDGRFVYAVTDTTVVSPEAMYIIEQTTSRTATLFACHPPGSTKQRIVVHLALQP
jgi:sortase A